MATTVAITTTTLEPELEKSGITTLDIILGLVIFCIMIGVGITMDRVLLQHIMTTKIAIYAACLGVSCQYIVMPFIAYLLTLIFSVEKFQALGFIVMGSVPGGSLSNVLTHYGKGIVELSIFMSLVSTIIAFGMTTLCLFMYSKAIDIDSTSMDFIGLLIALVLLFVPLIIGALMGYFFPNIREMTQKILGVLTAGFIIAALIIVGIEYSEALEQATWRIWVPAVLAYPITSTVSYCLSYFVFGFKAAASRTISIEVSFQNSVLVYSLIELSLKKRSERTQAAAYPLCYTIFMFVWAGGIIPLMRYQHEYNLENKIEDHEREFDVMMFGEGHELQEHQAQHEHSPQLPTEGGSCAADADADGDGGDNENEREEQPTASPDMPEGPWEKNDDDDEKKMVASETAEEETAKVQNPFSPE